LDLTSELISQIGQKIQNLKPWPNEVTSINAGLELRTCRDRLAMGGQMDSQVDASSIQIGKKSLVHMPVLRTTMTSIDLHCKLGGQTVKNLCLLVLKLELVQSECKSSQAITRTQKSQPNGSQVIAFNL